MILRNQRGRIGRFILPLLVASMIPGTVAGLQATPERSPIGTPAQVGPFQFQTGPYELIDLPIELLPYYGPTVVPSCGLTDPSGVAMFQTGGVIYNHPVAQSRCALNMLRNYRLTGDPAHLDTAIANANRLLSRAVSHAGGLFFPYPFNWFNPGRGAMTPPWYSAMAQGQALSAFVRLFEWTQDTKWRQAADLAFASFKVARASGKPWVVGVEDGLLWLDEYPTTPLDRVFNGHNFSMFGLYDYWRLTGNAEARHLVLGALHSSYVGASSAIRVPGGISQYCWSDACLANKVRNPAYHITHIGQLTKIFHMTAHWHFASLAEAFIGDSPRTDAGRAELVPGTHTGYEFDAGGSGSPVKTVTLPGTTKLAYSRRDVPGGRFRPGNGIWLRISEGSLEGLWVRESDRARPLGFTDTIDFHWNRTVRLSSGTYIARTFDTSGSATGSATTSTSGGAWSYSRYARINGSPSVLLTSGPLAGSWLALDRRTTRDSTAFTDIDASAFRNEIIWLTDQRITRGCATYRFCPTASVTREQMASFLVRALSLPASAIDYYADDAGRPAEADINALAQAEVTAGCGPKRYCPTAPVTRAQMASFLARALRLPAARRDYFSDDARSPHQGDINRLAESGITGGCGDGRFCPGATVTRGQMAAFIYRALASATVAATQVVPEPSIQINPSPSPEPSTESTLAPAPSAAAEPASSPTPDDSVEPSEAPTVTAEPSAPPSPSSSESPEIQPSPSPSPSP